MRAYAHPSTPECESLASPRLSARGLGDKHSLVCVLIVGYVCLLMIKHWSEVKLYMGMECRESQREHV